MKQVLLSGQGQVEVFDVPVPLRGPGGVLVRTTYSLISSGTEGAAVASRPGWLGVLEKARRSPARVEQVWRLAKTQGVGPTWDLLRNKLADYTPLGYSAVGEIIEVDDPAGPFRVGQTLACVGGGVANHAEYLAVPQNLALPVPAGVPPEQAAFGAIGCIAMQGIRGLEAEPGEWIGVIGLGLIGQVTVRLLRAMGYEVCATDLVENRVALAAGAGCEAWAMGAVDGVRRALDLTNGRGLDGVIICAATQSDAPVNLAFDLCRQRGRVSVVGDVGLGLAREKMYRKELELRMSTSYGPGRYDPGYELEGRDYPAGLVRWTSRRNLEHFLRLLSERRIDLTPLVSARYPIDGAPAAYARVKAGEPGDFGVLFEYRNGTAQSAQRTLRRPASAPRPTGSGPVRLGLIGVGNYVKTMHLPNLRRLSERVIVSGVASRGGSAAAVAGRRWEIPLVTSDYRELLADSSIEAVLIATRHASHASIACAALEAGKHVFVEKPLAITVEDARAVHDLARATGLVVRVGFNRRFSPWTQSLRRVLGTSGRRSVTIRVNVGDLGDHWSNATEEGGRLMGEGVHFFDLANWLLGQSPSAISAEFVGPARVENPNAEVSISYPDGSLARVQYSTLGSAAMGKEYFEVAGNGRSARCDDYREFSAFGAAERAPKEQGNKGQLGVLEEFAAAVRGESSPVAGAGAWDGLLATWIAATAYESASRGIRISRPEE